MKACNVFHLKFRLIVVGSCKPGRRLRFEWPPEVTMAMDMLFSMMNILPSVNVAFAASCEAQALLPGNTAAHQLAPALYFFVLPLLALTGTIVLSAFVVYIVVPLGKKLGFAFSKFDRKRRKQLQLARSVVQRVRDTYADGDLKLHQHVMQMSGGHLDAIFASLHAACVDSSPGLQMRCRAGTLRSKTVGGRKFCSQTVQHHCDETSVKLYVDKRKPAFICKNLTSRTLSLSKNGGE